MRIGLAFVAALADRDRVDPFGQRGGGDIAEIGQELLEPQFKIEAVPEDQIGVLRGEDISWSGFVAVDLGGSRQPPSHAVRPRFGPCRRGR
jgi:hypothetical protein